MSDVEGGHATEQRNRKRKNHFICVVDRRKIFLNVPLSTPQNIFLGRLAAKAIFHFRTEAQNAEFVQNWPEYEEK